MCSLADTASVSDLPPRYIEDICYADQPLPPYSGGRGPKRSHFLTKMAECNNSGSLLPQKNRRGTIEMCLSLADNIVFVYPNVGLRRNSSTDADDNGEEDVENALFLTKKSYFVVTVTFTVPRACGTTRTVQSLTIELTSRESLGFQEGSFESSHLSLASKTIAEAEGLELIPGNVYQLETVLEVPSTVAPYEWSRYGRNLPKITAKAKLSSSQTNTPATTSKSWKGLASTFTDWTKTLEASQNVWIMAVPRSSNVLDYARTHHTAVNQLGPISIHMRSQHLTVGGYLRMGLTLPAPAPGVTVHRIVFTVIQQVTLHSRRGGTISKCAPERIPIFTIEGAELLKCISSPPADNGEAMSLPISGDWIAKLPSDDVIRPTTLEGSRQAALKITHSLETRVHFCTAPTPENSNESLKTIYSAAWPITLASCCCLCRSLKLPLYSKDDPCPVNDAAATAASMSKQRAMVADAWRRQIAPTSSTHLFCMCGVSMDDILVYEAEVDAAQGSSSINLLKQELRLANSIRRNSTGSTEAVTSLLRSNSNTPNDNEIDQSMSENDFLRRRLDEKARNEYHTSE